MKSIEEILSTQDHQLSITAPVHHQYNHAKIAVVLPTGQYITFFNNKIQFK